MNSDLSLTLKLLLNNRNLSQGLQSSKNSVTSFAKSARNEINALRSSFNSLAGRVAQIGVAFSSVQQIIKSAHLDQDIIRIGQTAKATKSQIAGLRHELFSMGKTSGVDVNNLLLGFDNLIASGQSWDQALASIKAINVAIAVTKANGDTLANTLTIASTAFDFDLSKAGEAKKFLDEMTAAGRAGNAELEALADIISRIGTNAASAGLNRKQALAFVETLSLVEKQPERLATLADSTLRLFNNQNYSKTAEEHTGVKFFDKKGARRDMIEVISDMKSRFDKLKTDADKNNFIFSAFGKADLDTQKGIKTLFTGDMINQYKSIYEEINSSRGTLDKDLSGAINNSIDQVGRLKTALREAADEFAKPVNEATTNAIKLLMDKKENGGHELSGKEMIGGGIAATIAALLAARLGGKLVKGAADKFLGIGEGVAIGKTLEASTGIPSVYVVNMPGAGLGLPSFNGKDVLGLPATKPKLTMPKSALSTGGFALAPLALMGLITQWVGDKSHDVQRVDTLKSLTDALNKFIGHDPDAAQKEHRKNLDRELITVNVHLDGEQIANSVESRFTNQGNRR